MTRRRRYVYWILGVLAVLFVALQFRTVERTNPPVVANVDAPPEVEALLRRACYDCHSHETHWPWYSRVAPVSWWVVDHVEHGRRDLNFSDWPLFDFEAQDIEFIDIREQVANGEMPLASYTLLHPAARLSDAERALLVRWASP